MRTAKPFRGPSTQGVEGRGRGEGRGGEGRGGEGVGFREIFSLVRICTKSEWRAIFWNKTQIPLFSSEM